MGAFDDLLPQQPQASNAFSDLIPSTSGGGQGSAFADLVPPPRPGALGKIGAAAIEPGREIFSTPLGVAGQNPETQSLAGKFTEPSPFETQHPLLSRLFMLPTIRQLNRSVIEGGSALGDTLMRGMSAVVEGGISGGAETLKQLGMDPAKADSLARDMYALAQTGSFIGMASPHMPAMPRSAAAVDRAATLERETPPVPETGGVRPAAPEGATVAPRAAGAFDDLVPKPSETSKAPNAGAVPENPLLTETDLATLRDAFGVGSKEYQEALRTFDAQQPSSPLTTNDYPRLSTLAGQYAAEAERTGREGVSTDVGPYDAAVLRQKTANEPGAPGAPGVSAPSPDALAAFRSELQRTPDNVLDRLDREERNPIVRSGLEEELTRRGRQPVGPVEPPAPEVAATVRPKVTPEEPFETETLPLKSGRTVTWKGPMDLATWLRSQGGIKDEGGELLHAGIGNFPRKGVPYAAGEWKLGGLVKDNGMDLDTAALRAWEAGYFPGHAERPTVNEFLDALRGTHNARSIGSRAFRQRDWDQIEAAERNAFDVDRVAHDLDLDISGLTPEEATNRVREEMGLTERPASLTERERMTSAPSIGKATTPEGEAFLEAMRGTNRTKPPGRVVEVDNLQSVEDIGRAYDTLKEQHAGSIDRARRGVVSHEVTQALADDLGMDVESLLKRHMGKAFNAHEGLAARQLLAESMESMVEAARNARTHNSDANLVAFQRAYTRAVAVMEHVAGMKAEAGRALEAMKIKGATEKARAAALRNIIDNAGRDRLETLVDSIASLNNPEQVARFAREAYKAKTSDRLLEVWYNTILSGPRTHATNILSNTLTALWTVPEKAVAAGFGALRRGPDKVLASEVAQDAFGIIEGARDGLRLAVEAFKREEPSDLNSKLEVHRGKAISGRKGEIIRVPSRLLMAEDELFKAIARRQEINSQAVRIATKEGKTGREFVARVADLKANPTEEMMDAAHLRASYQTFQKKLSPRMQKLSAFLTDTPALRLLVPFVRTPTNLFLYAGERTPLGFAFKDTRDALLGRHGGAEADIARARMALGTAVAVAVTSLAVEGLVTGAGPQDTAERSGLALTKAPPFSIKIGGKWYSYRRLDPFAPVLGVAADLAQLVQTYEGARSDKAKETASQLVYMLSQNVADKEWFGTLADVGAAMQDPDQFGPRFVKRMVGSLIPAGVAQVTQAFEPYAKDTRDLGSYLKARAGLGGDLPPARDIWGEPKQNPDTLGPRVLSPITVQEQRTDKASLEVARLKLGIKMPDRRLGLGETDKEYKTDLSPQEYDDYARIAGQMARRGVDAIVNAPVYDRMPEAMKQKLLRQAFDDARKTAKGFLFRAHPDLVQRLASEKREELTRPGRPLPPQLQSGAFDDLVPAVR